MLTFNIIVFWPFLIYALAVIILVSIMISLSWVLGERHKEKSTDEPYESGIPPTGDARLRFSSSFYLIAMFFVIFDLESVFVFAWAVAARDVGWPGYAAVTVFIGALLAALVYLWRSGALEWGPSKRAPSTRIGQGGSP